MNSSHKRDFKYEEKFDKISLITRMCKKFHNLYKFTFNKNKGRTFHLSHHDNWNSS